jgi:alkylation response protein AidB-like acyl-CoA dehydrogenase
MWTYNAPLRDMHFVIEEVLQAPAAWAQTPAFEDLDADTSRQILQEAGKFANGVLAPINGAADLEGCKWVDGNVTTPQGYPAVYKAYVEGGWPALACDPAYGGQGLPQLLNAALNEMIAAANHGWTMYPGLLHGAYDCIKAHGSDALKTRYLEKLTSGEWLATMNLSEPQAGSDLSQVRTKAEIGPMTDDGASWLITGSKIWISGGDQDMTDNIVHLVLCRLPDAPAGNKGLSLMVAPKFLPDGTRNKIRCDGIEKKMGIKGSATSAMSFDGATGWLVGEPHKGLTAMFVMMNSARLHVAMQGLGHLEMAQQNAHAYASERVQGKAKKKVDGKPGTIDQHPAVRRNLWSLRSLCEGERVIAYWTAQLLDEAHSHPDTARRAKAEDLVALLTPVAKAFFTDNGNRGANEALQVWGGYGYVHEYGIEQTVRDSRIAMIYEGTNEIQAIDLLQRKIMSDGGAKLLDLLAVLEQELEAGVGEPELNEFTNALSTQIAATREAVDALLAAREADPDWSLRVADDFLRGLGFTLLAWAWARSARVALPQVADAWYADKVKAARFGVQWLLPEASYRWQRVMAREAVLPEIG